MTHTPTPWFVAKQRGKANRVIGKWQGQDFMPIAKANASYLDGVSNGKHNAQFIVTACNAYDQNQQTIKELVEALEIVVNTYNHHVVNGASNSEKWENAFEVVATIAEERLVKAKAKQ